MLPHVYTDCDQNKNKIQIRNTNDDNIMQYDRIFTLIPGTWMDLCLTNQSVTISQQGQELNEVRAIV